MSVPLDVRYGLRRLNNNVGFTAVAVACLALGICASITVFAVVDSLLLRDLPGVARQDGLVSVATRLTGGTGEREPISLQTFTRYRQACRMFSDLAAFYPVQMNLSNTSGTWEPLRAAGQMVSDNYFRTLGMQAAEGRFFLPGGGGREDRRQVVLNHALRRKLFGGRKAVGATVRLNGQLFLVIGVAPEGFRGTVLNSPADLWVPAETASLFLPPIMRAARDPWGSPWLHLFVGRLAPGANIERAQTDLDVLASQLAQGVPRDQRPPGLQIHPDFGYWPGVRGEVTDRLLILSGLVGLLMLVVCANLGGLLLVKAAGRQEEIGVRLALGVTRAQLVRQLLTESVALSLFGGGVGFLLALYVIDAIQGWALGQYLPKLDNVAVDGRVVLFTIVFSAGAGLLFGLAPALWSTRRQPMPLLHRAGGGSPDHSRLRLQETLVVGQVTLSLMLLVSTGLFVRTLQNLYSVDPGFDSGNLLKMTFDLSLQRYTEQDGAQLQSQLLEEVRNLPQVRAAALSLNVPLASSTPVRFGGTLRLPSAPGFAPLESDYNVVTPGFFQTLGIPVLRGRDFTPEDREGSTLVMIVDQALAAELWPGRDPVGEQVTLLTHGDWVPLQVVGVVRGIHASLSSDPTPFFYLPLAQRYMPTVSLQVKTAGEPALALGPVRNAFRKLAPDLPVQASFLEDEVNRTLATPRLFSLLLGAFSLTALLVTAIGLYGTLSYAVSRRTRELGIRMALGARSSEIMGMVLRKGLGLTLLGLALGTLAAVWATTIFSEYLFGVTPTDPGVFFTVAAILTLVGLLASSLPAWRATRVDPMAIIRHE
jgi:predicted permease